MISKYFLILIVSFLFVFKGYCQLEKGGIPPSFEDYYLDDQFQILNLNPPDIIEEEPNPDKMLPPKVGQTIPVYFTTSNCGTWTVNNDGSKIWRLGIRVSGALALAVYYSAFDLPDGSELYLYNNSRDYVIGAFSSLNNDNGGAFATRLVPGDEITLEYYQPEEV